MGGDGDDGRKLKALCVNGLLQVSGLLVADFVENNSHNVHAHAPIIDGVVDEVAASRILSAMAARPNAHHAVGLELEMWRKSVEYFVVRVDAALEHPVLQVHVLVAARVLQYDDFAVRRALADGHGALGAALERRLRAHLARGQTKVSRCWRRYVCWLWRLLW